jgi:hypothetical protein
MDRSSLDHPLTTVSYTGINAWPGFDIHQPWGKLPEQKKAKNAPNSNQSLI